MTYLEKTVKLYAAREALAASLNLTVTDAEVDQRGPFRDGYQGQTTNLYELGKTTGSFQGVDLPVYDRERTICDCFKYRSRLDNEMFSKALNAYANDTKKNLSNLSAYARKLRVYKKVTELMEVLLNG